MKKVSGHNMVYLLLGSNIEPRYEYIKKAKDIIIEEIGEVTKSSKIYESEAIGFTADISFLNCVILVNCDFSSLEIINKIHTIERGLGRQRDSLGYSSRTIDIDILYFNNDIINANGLIIPHPRLHERRFTLLPLTEIAPYLINPVLELNNKELLDNCSDNSEVTIFKYR
ncbi:MAG: 2-amino-4-hydroxy-6-hydroxymethyldihydropteridine diphosphokinase [Bacteroidota bacterium]